MNAFDFKTSTAPSPHPPSLQLPDGVPEEMYMGGVAYINQYSHAPAISSSLYKWICALERPPGTFADPPESFISVRKHYLFEKVLA